MGSNGWLLAMVFLLMAMILVALGSGLYYLVSDKKRNPNTVKALTWRIGLSIFLFLLLFFAFAMGWIRPHGLMGPAQGPVKTDSSEKSAEP